MLDGDQIIQNNEKAGILYFPVMFLMSLLWKKFTTYETGRTSLL